MYRRYLYSKYLKTRLGVENGIVEAEILEKPAPTPTVQLEKDPLQLSLFNKRNFASQHHLEYHFEKHKKEFKGAYNTAEEYLEGANFTIEHGHLVKYIYKQEERMGYVRFFGNAKDRSIEDVINNLTRQEMGVSKYHIYGEAKFEFVAINHNGTIATYHTQAGSKMYSNIKHGKNNFKVEKLSCKTM